VALSYQHNSASEFPPVIWIFHQGGSTVGSNENLVPWRLDGGDDGEQPVYRNECVDDYLDLATLKESKALLGAKGTGKTLLLRERYRAIRKSDWEPNVFPTDAFCESIGPHIWASGAKDHDLLSDPGYWRELWICAVTVVAAYHETRRIPESLQSMFDDKNPPLTLSSVIWNWFASSARKRQRVERGRIEADILSMIPQLKEDHCFFLDDADEISATSIKQATIEWRAAQRGLLLAIHRLSKSTKRIRIYTTVRPQAMKCMGVLSWQEELNPQLAGKLVELVYTKNDLVSAFETHCTFTEGKYLDASYAKPVSRFLKRENIRVNGEEEPAIDYIWRHTFGRPRDMIYIGAKLKSASSHSDEVFRDLVNAAGSELFKSYLDEIFKFGKEGILHGMSLISTNVIYPEEARLVTKIIEKSIYFDGQYVGQEKGRVPFRDWSAHVTAAGLIGVPTHRMNGDYELRFQTGGLHVYPDDRISMPIANYYVLHPAMYHFLRVNRKNLPYTHDFNVSLHCACDSLKVSPNFDRTGANRRVFFSSDALHVGESEFVIDKERIISVTFLAAVLLMHTSSKPLISASLRALTLNVLRALGYSYSESHFWSDTDTAWNENYQGKKSVGEFETSGEDRVRPKGGDYRSFSNNKILKQMRPMLISLGLNIEINGNSARLAGDLEKLKAVDCQSIGLLSYLGELLHESDRSN
jgi:hypothetical protein